MLTQLIQEKWLWEHLGKQNADLLRKCRARLESLHTSRSQIEASYFQNPPMTSTSLAFSDHQRCAFQRDRDVNRQSDVQQVEEHFPRPVGFGGRRSIAWTPQSEAVTHELVSFLGLSNDSDRLPDDCADKERLRHIGSATGLSPAIIEEMISLRAAAPSSARWAFIAFVLRRYQAVFGPTMSMETALSTASLLPCACESTPARVLLSICTPICPRINGADVELHFRNTYSAETRFHEIDDAELIFAVGQFNSITGSAIFVGPQSPYSESHPHPRRNFWLSVAAQSSSWKSMTRGRSKRYSPMACLRRFQRFLNKDFIIARPAENPAIRTLVASTFKSLGVEDSFRVTVSIVETLQKSAFSGSCEFRTTGFVSEQYIAQEAARISRNLTSASTLKAVANPTFDVYAAQIPPSARWAAVFATLIFARAEPQSYRPRNFACEIAAAAAAAADPRTYFHPAIFMRLYLISLDRLRSEPDPDKNTSARSAALKRSRVNSHSQTYPAQRIALSRTVSGPRGVDILEE